jgi:hemoglobin
VRDDRLLAPLFSHLAADHPEHGAVWLSEVIGGPDRYTAELGGYEHMVAKHHGLAITEAQRARWAALIALAADAGLPADPEFRSAFAASIEWGTRLVVANSQPHATPPRAGAPLGVG